jgi:dTDP-4-amino-4,6-dideoxygalactose transaminase
MSKTVQIPFGRPWVGDAERAAVAEVLSGHILTHGPRCATFEEEFATFLGPGAHCVSVSSCMAALHLSYIQIGVGPGDEVVVPAQTHVATVHAVEWVGARPVFVDCDPGTGNMTAAGIERALSPKTRAIGLVHFLGIPCDMQAIMDLARQRDLRVVEDCALAIGTRIGGLHVGLHGDAGCFSFYPVKHITTAEGGMFVSRHREVAEAVRRLRAFGVDRSHAERSVPGLYDVPGLGLNYRMSELSAALGIAQLARLPEILERRDVNFETLRSALAGEPNLRLLDLAGSEAVSSHYCASVVLEGPLAQHRNAVVARLKQAGVGTSIYYPHPVPRLSFYAGKYGYSADSYRNAAQVSDASIALPVGPHLTTGDVDLVAANLKRAIHEQ